MTEGNSIRRRDVTLDETASASNSARWPLLKTIDPDGRDRRLKGKEIVQYGSQRVSAHTDRRHARLSKTDARQNRAPPLPRNQYQEPPTEARSLSDVTHSNIKTEGDTRDHGPKLTDRSIDGMLTPGSGDLTVRLDLELQEDLEDQIEELVRLCRLGQFAVAKELFRENLQPHMNNPYVLVQHADMLLQKDDFKSVTLLKDGPISDLEKKIPESRELQLLRITWELIQLSAKIHTLDAINGVSTLFDEVTHVLRNLKDCENPVGSAEIKILGLTRQLMSNPVLEAIWLKRGQGAFDSVPTTLKHLYPILLRQGRIWDFHDLLTLLPTFRAVDEVLHNIFGTDLIASLKTLISHWSTPKFEYDSPTTLALLSILTHIALAPINAPLDYRIAAVKLSQDLAKSISLHDPKHMRTRPYLRFLIANSRFTELGSHIAISSLVNRLDISPGIKVHTDHSYLPIYVPKEAETPMWALKDSPPEAKESAELVLRAARSFADTKIEALSLQELIRLSGNPQKEFGELCGLQLTNGDLFGYSQILASKYLVTKTASDKETLKVELTNVLSRVATPDLCDPRWRWTITMLAYKLECRQLQAISYLLDKEFAYFHHMSVALLQQISRKMPEFSEWARRQLDYTKKHRRERPLLQARENIEFTGQEAKEESVRSQQSQETVRPQIHPITNLTAGDQPPESVFIESPSPQNAQQDDQASRFSTHSVISHAKSPERTRLKTRFILRPDSVNSQEPEDREDRQKEPYDYARGYEYRRRRQEAESYRTRIAVLERENFLLQEAERERSTRERDLANRTSERDAEKFSELKREKDARQAAESERDEYKNRLTIFESTTMDIMSRTVSSIENEREAMRKALIDLISEHDNQAGSVRKREAEEREKIITELKLDGEKRVNAIFQELAAEREKRVTTMKYEELVLTKVAQAAKEEKESLTLAQKLVEAAQNSGKIEIETQEMAGQEARDQAEEQAQRKKLGIRTRLMAGAEVPRNLENEAGKQEQEESREEIRNKDVDEAQRQANGNELIHFADARGRRYVFPFETCKVWSGMEEIIRQLFEYDDIIGPDVQAGYYDLVLDGAIILPQVWGSSVKPGSRVTMQVWPRTPPPETVDSASRPSPRSSDFHVEQSIGEVHSPNSASLAGESSHGSSSHLSSQDLRDRVPPLVPEAPPRPDEDSSSLVWPARSVSPTPSPHETPRAELEDSERDENPPRRSNATSYSARSETISLGPPVGRMRRRRFTTFLPTWRWRRFQSGVARTTTPSSSSDLRRERHSD